MPARRFPLHTWFLWLVAALLLLATHGINAEQVWLNTSSGVYHCEGTRWYANTKRGKFIEEETAVSRGYRPAYRSPCDPQAYAAGKAAIAKSLSRAPSSNADIQVWVNTRSHVYHCPGTRYYGKTKRGQYMSEKDALEGGNRGSRGARCH